MVIKTKLGSCISAAILNWNKHWFSYILSNYSQIFQLKGRWKELEKCQYDTLGMEGSLYLLTTTVLGANQSGGGLWISFLDVFSFWGGMFF